MAGALASGRLSSGFELSGLSHGKLQHSCSCSIAEMLGPTAKLDACGMTEGGKMYVVDILGEDENMGECKELPHFPLMVVFAFVFRPQKCVHNL